MAKWQPPIPAGALYSKPARTLGPALPLLAYCYDLVQRDGWFDLNLKDAAGDMEEAYPTIKRWWQIITDGPFFAEVQNHGRKGLRVRFKDIWIEWRILKAREVVLETFGTETGSELIPNTDNTANRNGNGIIIGTETGSELIPQNNVYGTHDTDLALSISGAKNSRTPHTKNPPKKPPTPIPIRDALADVCGIGKISTREQQLQLNQSAAQIWKEQELAGVSADQVVCNIAQAADYFHKHDWRGKKGQPPTPAQIREVWGKAHTNGKHIRQGTERNPERKPQVEADLTDGFG